MSATAVKERSTAETTEAMTVPIAKLIIDSEIQIRRTVLPWTVARYKGSFDRLIQRWPIEVFDTDDGLLLAAGFTRVETAKQLGRSEIKAIVLKGTRADALERAVTSNVDHGEPLNIHERDAGIRRLQDLHPANGGNPWTMQQIADAMSVSKATVVNVLKSEAVREVTCNQMLSDSHMREIGRANEEQWQPLVDAAMAEEWSVEETIYAVRLSKEGETLSNIIEKRRRIREADKVREAAKAAKSTKAKKHNRQKSTAQQAQPTFGNAFNNARPVARPAENGQAVETIVEERAGTSADARLAPEVATLLLTQQSAWKCTDCENTTTDEPASLRECSHEDCGAQFTASEGNNCSECNRPFTRRVADHGCEECDEGESEAVSVVECNGDYKPVEEFNAELVVCTTCALMLHPDLAHECVSTSPEVEALTYKLDVTISVIDKTGTRPEPWYSIDGAPLTVAQIEAIRTCIGHILKGEVS